MKIYQAIIKRQKGEINKESLEALKPLLKELEQLSDRQGKTIKFLITGDEVEIRPLY